jgi:hypothetical protein
MKSKSNQTKSAIVNSNIGLRVIFSEKAIVALLYVVLMLGLAYLKFNSPVHQGIPVKASQNKQSE